MKESKISKLFRMKLSPEIIFNTGVIIFWSLLLSLFIFTLLDFTDDLFFGKSLPYEILHKEKSKKYIDTSKSDSLLVRQRLDSVIDSTQTNDSTISVEWSWYDFNNHFQVILFKYKQRNLEKSRINRMLTTTYQELLIHDTPFLDDLIFSIKNNIKQQDLDYLGAINYVCSAIQYNPYTLVIPSIGIEIPTGSGKYFNCPCELKGMKFTANCEPQLDGLGCCNNVDPIGVYSPLEYAVGRTGDCDTRSLLAFTILRSIGYDVAVMTSESQSHSVLGVSLPNSSLYSNATDRNGKRYVLWELTSKDWRLGFPVQGKDWKVSLST